MTDPTISIFFDRERAPGANSLSEFEALPGKYLADAHVPLAEAMSRCWEHDAHMALYVARDEEGSPVYLRANKRGSTFAADLMQAGGRVECAVLVFDHDLPKDGGLKQSWTEEGLGEFLRLLTESDLPLPTYWYTTKHGSRFVFVLTEPVSHVAAEGLCLGIMRDFSAKGIELDRACSDWTRLFRLPRVLRSDKQKDGSVTKHRSEEAGYFQLYEFDTVLDASTITPGEATSALDEFAQVEQYAGERPSHEECHELLWDVSPKTGREVKSKWQKDARTYLTGRDAWDYCFNHKVIDEDDRFAGKKFAGSNDALVRIFGQIVGQLSAVEGATPEGIYAIMLDCIDQMEPTAKHPDWHSTAWDILIRLWNNEQAQLEAQRRERDQEIAQAVEARQDLLSLFREKLPGQVPADDTQARDWLRQRMIASTGQAHHILMRDGTYTVNACNDAMLIPTIRDLGMTDVIETHELHGKVWREKSPRNILNGQAIPITRVVCSSVEEVAYITGDPGYRMLTIPVHQLDPHITPEFSGEVDEWLQHFFGERYDRGVEWLGHALDVKRPICAINLFGAPGAGKDMLVQGIAECFRYKTKTEGAKVFTRFNDPLLETPIVHFNEGVPLGNMPGCSTTDQTFRALVSGGSISVEGKGVRTNTGVFLYPRIIFTSNDRDILRSIVGNRDLTDQDIEGIEVRLLSIEVPSTATRYLTQRGNQRYTAGWIKGEVASRFIIAKHLRWLYENRKPAKVGSGRLLVEGDMNTGLMRDMRMTTDIASAVVRTIAKMVENPNGAEGMHIDGGRVWVLPYGIQRHYEKHLADTMHAKLTGVNIGKVLRQLSYEEEAPDPLRLPGQDASLAKQRWRELDLRVLIHEAIKNGMPRDRMERLVKERHGVEEVARIHGLFKGKAT